MRQPPRSLANEQPRIIVRRALPDQRGGFDSLRYCRDAYEHRTFRNFETFFNIRVWYVCFPPEEPAACHLFLNSDLTGLPVVKRQAKETIAVPLKDTVIADPRRDFMGVLLSAISLR